jgi:hypothetical protein
MPYSSQKFIDIEGNSNGFFVNTANFFLSNMIIIVGMFLILRMLFFLLFKYRISIFFRQYSFWPYLVVILLDGNLQFASFLVGFELKWLFAHSISNKILTIWLLIIFFFIFTFSIGSYFFFRYFYDGLAKYFMESMGNSNSAAFYMLIHYGVRNILSGFLHSIDDQFYKSKIMALLLTEIAFLAFSIYSMSHKNVAQ